MKTIIIYKDIHLLYVQAKSFPEGITEAYEKLHKLLPPSSERITYGISRPENGQGIVYRAAAEQLVSSEAEIFQLSSLTLKKGKYVSITINDYRKDTLNIEKAFQELLAHPDLDPEGYCVERYDEDKDVTCMIRLAN